MFLSSLRFRPQEHPATGRKGPKAGDEVNLRPSSFTNLYYFHAAIEYVLSATLQNLRKDAEMRVMTDTRVSPLWMLVPIATLLLALTEAVLVLAVSSSMLAAISSGNPYNQSVPGLFAGTTVLTFTALILALSVAFLYVIYLLIRRRNQHSARQQRFFTDLSMALREAA